MMTLGGQATGPAGDRGRRVIASEEGSGDDPERRGRRVTCAGVDAESEQRTGSACSSCTRPGQGSHPEHRSHRLTSIMILGTTRTAQSPRDAAATSHTDRHTALSQRSSIQPHCTRL
eukprot:1984675-Rhodomonas_salina.4